MTFPQSLTIQINSIFGEEKKVLKQIDQLSLSFPNLKIDFNEFKAAVAEACINAIEHGNLENHRLPILVDITITEYKVTCTVCDKGKGFTSFKLKELYSERGWGLEIINHFVDWWTVWCPTEGDYSFCIQLEKRISVING